jgi:Zn-finger nucleic acid-binding protein
LYCRNCYGFWAAGDSLSQGFESEYVDDPALIAAQAPPRCRECFGYLKPDGMCAKCGKSRPPMACPVCSRAMQRFDRGGVTLDGCEPCHGVWFDMGELAAVYGLKPGEERPLPGVGDPNQPQQSGHEALNAAFIIARTFLPFIGL